MSTDTSPPVPSPAVPGAATGTPVRVAGLRKVYPRTVALDDVSLDLPGGQFVAVLGPSGAGKTTLLRTLTGMVRPDAGRIHIGDEELTALHGRARRAAGG